MSKQNNFHLENNSLCPKIIVPSFILVPPHDVFAFVVLNLVYGRLYDIGYYVLKSSAVEKKASIC